MRRLVLIGTALAAIAGAAAAYAATHFNSYTGSRLAISRGVKSTLTLVETLNATAPAGDRAAPLTDIEVKIYGVKMDVGKLPVCTDAKIVANKTSPTGDCPKGSLIGTGGVRSLLGPGSDPSSSKGTPCNPSLNVFAGGSSTQVFYFFTRHATDCGGLTTGATAPWDGHISYAGGYAVVNVPLPPDISTKVANLPNYWGSLIHQAVNFSKTNTGKPYMVGTKCKAGRRPWSITFTAQGYNGGGSDTQTVSGSSKC